MMRNPPVVKELKDKISLVYTIKSRVSGKPLGVMCQW